MYTNNYSNSVSTNSLYKVYSWMMVGLGITAITSALLYASGIFMLIIQIPMISLLLFIVQISLTISMGRQLSRNTPASTMKTMFIVYSLTMGINMTSLAYVYSAGQIAAAFGISAIYFACLAIIGIGITFRFTAAFAHLAPAVGTIRKATVRLQRHHGYFYPSQVLCLPPSLCEL